MKIVWVAIILIGYLIARETITMEIKWNYQQTEK